jgi:uncharacterized protein DUF2071
MTFEMAGRIDECFLLSYAIDPKQVSALVPAGLDTVTCHGAAFLNIVVCHVDRMRPRFTPRGLGITYWHVAYRVQVRAQQTGGASIEGLYFLRSDVNHRLFGALGNRMTDFRFHAADVQFSPRGGEWNLRVIDPSSDGDATLRMRRASTDGLMADSPFSSVEERERVLKYAPFALSVSNSGKSVRVAEVIRDEALWRETPVEVVAAEWTYALRLGVPDMHLVRATQVAAIDYVWRIGRSENLTFPRSF